MKISPASRSPRSTLRKPLCPDGGKRKAPMYLERDYEGVMICPMEFCVLPVSLEYKPGIVQIVKTSSAINGYGWMVRWTTAIGSFREKIWVRTMDDAIRQAQEYLGRYAGKK